MANGTITLRDGGLSHTGRIEVTVEAIEEEEILAVAGNQVTRSRIRVVSDHSKQTVHEGGQSNSLTERNSLAGGGQFTQSLFTGVVVPK
jgi:hypothetical protein